MVVNPMAIVSVSLPDALLKQVDQLTKAKAYAGRSEIVRASLRDFIAEQMQDPKRAGQRYATLTLVYPQGQERRIGEIRHQFGEVVQSLMHGDGGGECVEIFLVRGTGSLIQEFADRLRAFRATKLVKLVYTDASPPED